MPLASLLNIQHCSVQRPNRIEENEREETTFHCLYWKEEGEKKTVNSWEMYSSSRSPFLFLLLLGFAEESLKVQARTLSSSSVLWYAYLKCQSADQPKRVQKSRRVSFPSRHLHRVHVSSRFSRISTATSSPSFSLTVRRSVIVWCGRVCVFFFLQCIFSLSFFTVQSVFTCSRAERTIVYVE